MLDNIDIQYVEYECRVHIILYHGFFPCTKKCYRMIRDLLKHLPPDLAKDKAALVVLHIYDLQNDAQNLDGVLKDIMMEKVERQWKYYNEFLLPFLNYNGGYYATTKNL